MTKTTQNSRIFIGIPFYREPKCPAFVRSLIVTIKGLKESGYECYAGTVYGDSFVQRARAKLVQQFLKTDCDTMLFFDDDGEWGLDALLKLINTPGDVVAGVYRLKVEPSVIKYPHGICLDRDNLPIVRDDGCIKAWGVSMGFTKIKRQVFEKLIKAYPEKEYYSVKDGKPNDYYWDLFPQGVYDHRWLGEDYAFCRLWTNIGGKIWVIPDIDFIHHSQNDAYPGNYHEYLMRLPGGCKENKK